MIRAQLARKLLARTNARQYPCTIPPSTDTAAPLT